MLTFLYVVCGVVVGGILLIFIAYLLLKLFLRRLFKKFAEQLKTMASEVPPFRIHLKKRADAEWQNGPAVEAISEHLRALGYGVIGDFSMDEVPTVKLRGFANEAQGFYGVVYEYDQMGIIADIACDIEGDLHLTATTAPEAGLDTPGFIRNFRFSHDLAAEPATVVELHKRLLEETKGHKVVPAPADQFVARVEAYHAREMDWRVEKGGVTAEEVRRVAKCSNLEPPDDAAVAIVQNQRKYAISSFMEQKIRERFLRHATKMSASQWEDVRERLFIVHERSMEDALIDELKWRGEEGMEAEDSEESSDLEDEQRLESLEGLLRNYFDGKPVRDAFAQAQAALPEGRRFRRLARITGP